MLKISNKAEFFIFLLEKYAEKKSLSASETLKIWEKAGLINYINAMYEQYHTERIENAIEDIDRKLLNI
jgi:ATP-dependent RNA circularization protein (DNA/RNA ligase family)